MSRYSCLVVRALFVAFCVAAALPVLATPTIPASAYVQAGLIAQWDGIENAGVGQHDASATTWKDLKGTADVTLGDGDSVCEGAGVIVTDKRAFAGVPSANASSPKTLEIAAVETVDIGVNQAARIFFLERRLGMSFDHRYVGGTFNVATSRDSAPGVCYFQNVKNDPTPTEAGKFHTYSAILGMSKAMTPYYDGAITTMGSNLNWVDNISGTADGSGYIGASIFKPRIYSIRLYDHALTSGEIAVNANIDKIRFEDADPGALVWPDGYRWNAEKGLVELAVTVVYGGGIVSVMAEGESVADGGLVWTAVNGGGFSLAATRASDAEAVQWSAENATVVASVRGSSAALSAVLSPTALYVTGVSKSTLSDLPINGLVQHYDATDLDTIITNAEGNVLEWSSKVVNAANPVVPALKGWCYSDSLNPANFPFYSAAQLEGRGGIVTGRSLAGEKAGETVCLLSGMTGTVATVNRTVFLVIRPFPKLKDEKGDSINRGVFFGEATSKTALGLYTDSNAQGVNNQGGFCAGGWLWQDGYCFSQPGSGSDLTTILKSVNRTQLAAAECTDAKMRAFPSFRPAIARPWAPNYGHVHGAYGELVIYDRVLKQGEITYVNARLRDKWLDSDIVRKRTKWIGGASGSWNVAANWDNGVPDGSRVAVIANAAVMVTDGDGSAWDLELKDATLTLAAGAMLRVEEVTAAYGASTIAVGAGATFATDDWCEPWGAGPTVSLAGGRFVYMPHPTSVRRSWFKAGDCNNDAGASFVTMKQLDSDTLDATHRSMLPKVTGTGELCCAGAGVTELDAEHLPAEGLALTVAGGALELNGYDLKVKSLDGTAILRNSGAPATVTVENADEALLTPHLEGAVKVVATGGGSFRHIGGGAAKGGIEVDGSTLVAAADVIERNYGNPVIHLDASMPETMVTNTAGLILRWNSSDAQGKSFSVHPLTTVNGNTYTNGAPVWSATAFNGKPAALFSVNAAGTGSAMTNRPAVIRATAASTNLTFFVVGQFYGGASSDWGAHFFGFVGSAFAGGKTFLSSQSVGDEKYRYWGFGASFPYALDNGKVLYDADHGVTEAVHYSALLKRDLVLAYRAGDAVEGVYAPTIACGDQSYLQRAMSGKFCEILVYDRRLSDEAMKEISAQLMKKWGIEPSEGADPVATKGSLNSQSTIALKNGAAIDLGGETNVVRKLETSGTVTVSNGALKVGALDVVLGDDGAYGAVRGDADWDVDGMALAFVGDARPAYGNIVRTSGTLSGTLGPISPSAVAPRVKTSVSRIWIPGGLLLFVK